MSLSTLAPPAGGEVTWTDLFCGGGGSSLGIHHVPGHQVRYAINHWDLAIEAHQANFPDTDHEVSDIETVHPRRFGRTDCAWFSPSCTSHAYCGPRGADEDSVRSRATMWDVVRWTAHHAYDAVIVENVIEAKLWCDVPGHGDRCGCGNTYDSWLADLLNLGYEHREVYFNSQFAHVPQSRDRIYIVLWRRGLAAPNLNFAPTSWCAHCEDVVAGVHTWKPPTKARNGRLAEWGKYHKQYLYICPTCTSPVAPGVIGSHSIIDHALPIASIGSRRRPIAEATRRRIKVGLERLATTRPIQLAVGGNLFERPGYARVWSLDDPLRTVTTTPYMAMAVPAGGREAHGKSGSEPLHALTASDRLAVVMRAGGQAVAARTSDEPTMTLTAHDRQVGVLLSNMTNNVPRPLDEPSGAVTSGNRLALVSMRNHGTVDPVGEPARAVAASGNHHGLLVYNGNPGFVRVLDDAAGTITARDKQSLLVPYNRTAVAHGDHDPLTTVTTKDRSALVITDDDIDECLFRMLKWPELQKAQGMHLMPDGTAYQLTARVPTKKGGFRDLTDEQRVKMIGNAVSSPVAAILASAVSQSLAVAA